MQKIVRGIIFGLIIVLANVGFAAGGKYGPTTATDSIWKIAENMKPSEDVTTQQVALSIYYRNKDAFYSDNINALSSGKILEIPNAQIAKSISKEDATKELKAHARKWVARANSGKKENIIPVAYGMEEVKQQSKLIEEIDSSLDKQIKERTDDEGNPLPIESQPEEVLVEEQQEVAIQNPDSIDVVMPEGTKISETLVTPETVVGEDFTVAQSSDGSVIAEDSSVAVKDQGQSIGERLDRIEMQVNELIQFEKKMKHSFLGSFFLLMEGYSEGVLGALGPVLFMLIIGLIVLLLLVLLIYLIVPKHNEKYLQYPHDDSVEEGDFNYMDHEDNAAKLNLSRAYIDMGELDKAKGELQEVLLHGTDEEQDEAKEILNGIKDSSLV